MIAAHVSMMVLVNLGAGETPSAGLREGLINSGRRAVHEFARTFGEQATRVRHRDLIRGWFVQRRGGDAFGRSFVNLLFYPRFQPLLERFLALAR